MSFSGPNSSNLSLNHNPSDGTNKNGDNKEENLTKRKLGGYDFYRSIGSPKWIVAPMVDQSELPWRLLSRLYSAHLSFTPMLHSTHFSSPTPLYRQANFDLRPFDQSMEGKPGIDRPLVAQFCANEEGKWKTAAEMMREELGIELDEDENDQNGEETLVEKDSYEYGTMALGEWKVDAVDLNLGCPQGIAKRGHYGAFLQDERELVEKMISHLHQTLAIPVTAKFRVLPGPVEKTIEYAKMLERAGAQMVTVHGRTREMKGQWTGMADWDKIRSVKSVLKIPVFSNGNILLPRDLFFCLSHTNCDGIMSAESNLHNPALFFTGRKEEIEVSKKFREGLPRGLRDALEEVEEKSGMMKGWMEEIGRRMEECVGKDLGEDEDEPGAVFLPLPFVTAQLLAICRYLLTTVPPCLDPDSGENTMQPSSSSVSKFTSIRQQPSQTRSNNKESILSTPNLHAAFSFSALKSHLFRLWKPVWNDDKLPGILDDSQKTRYEELLNRRKDYDKMREKLGKSGAGRGKTEDERLSEYETWARDMEMMLECDVSTGLLSRNSLTSPFIIPPSKSKSKSKSDSDITTTPSSSDLESHFLESFQILSQIPYCYAQPHVRRRDDVAKGMGSTMIGHGHGLRVSGTRKGEDGLEMDVDVNDTLEKGMSDVNHVIGGVDGMAGGETEAELEGLKDVINDNINKRTATASSTPTSTFSASGQRPLKIRKLSTGDSFSIQDSTSGLPSKPLTCKGDTITGHECHNVAAARCSNVACSGCCRRISQKGLKEMKERESLRERMTSADGVRESDEDDAFTREDDVGNLDGDDDVEGSEAIDVDSGTALSGHCDFHFTKGSERRERKRKKAEMRSEARREQKARRVVLLKERTRVNKLKKEARQRERENEGGAEKKNTSA